MKIVDRVTFLAMPANTLFAKYAPCYVEDLTIKGDSLRHDSGEPFDFFTQEIALAVRCHDSGEMSAMLDDSQKHGTSVPMDFDCIGRDGCFDDDQLFAVYEEADVRALIARLAECLPDAIPVGDNA